MKGRRKKFYPDKTKTFDSTKATYHNKFLISIRLGVNSRKITKKSNKKTFQGKINIIFHINIFGGLKLKSCLINKSWKIVSTEQVIKA